MKGARPLSDEEIVNVYNELKGTRNKLLLILGVKSGLRISELLSLKLNSVMEYGKVGTQVKVQKKNTKGKIESRTIPLSESARKAIQEHLNQLNGLDLNQPLFKSEQTGLQLSRIRALKILKEAFTKLKLPGNCSSHSLRKTYSHKVHKLLGEKIEKTQIAMGHKSISSTVSYLQINHDEVKKAILDQG